MDILFTDDANVIRKYLQTLEGKSNINALMKNKWTPLYIAAKNNRTDVLDVLIEEGADLNTTSFGVTALNIASEKGHIDVVSKLLTAGADANIPNEMGDTPIMTAISEGHLHIAKLLTPYSNLHVNYGLDWNIFHLAILSNNNDVLDYIFEYCPDINYVTADGWTYLHYAVSSGNKYAVEFLLRKGVDINIENNKGKMAHQLTTDPEILVLFD